MFQVKYGTVCLMLRNKYRAVRYVAWRARRALAWHGPGKKSMVHLPYEHENRYLSGFTPSLHRGVLIYDGMMCVKDIDHFSNMSLVEANIYYGEE